MNKMDLAYPMKRFPPRLVDECILFMQGIINYLCGYLNIHS